MTSTKTGHSSQTSERKEDKEKVRQKNEGKTGQNTLLPCFQDRETLRSQQITSSIMSIPSKAASLHVIESHHAFHVSSSTLLKLPHH